MSEATPMRGPRESSRAHARTRAIGAPGGQVRDSQFDRLTPRELQTLAMLAEGRSNRAISEEFEITKRAVEGYINAIYGKLDLSDSGDVNRRVKAALLFLAAEPG
jgi:DNA-binding NarL/FixJ family response regulator